MRCLWKLGAPSGLCSGSEGFEVKMDESRMGLKCRVLFSSLQPQSRFPLSRALPLAREWRKPSVCDFAQSRISDEVHKTVSMLST